MEPAGVHFMPKLGKKTTVKKIFLIFFIFREMEPPKIFLIFQGKKTLKNILYFSK